MLSRYIRAISSDNSVLTDYSLVSQDRTNSFTLPITKSEDYLYIGQYFPTNNLYFSIGTANTNACTISVEIWNNGWVDAVDVLDGTSSSGKSMATSGIIQWGIDKDDMGWTRVSDPTQEASSFGLTSLKIYDLYWIRISFSESLSAGSTLKQIAYKFCTDNDLKAKAPDINDYLASWESGKANWSDQIIEGSKELVDYLKSQGLIKHAGNILRFDEVNTACSYLTLSLIHNGIGGDDFIALADREYGKFLKHIKNMPIVVDINSNASVEVDQEINKTYFGKLVR